ncbi:MAG TPA: hypothetical protein VE571_11920, partial [Solirubrobacteraceae bacterium]|nr:hypothetical protein [Solirubrobacteraceae bacterium]
DQAWAQVPDVVKSGMISATLDQAGRAIGAAAAGGGFDRSDAVVARREMVLDEQGFAQFATELNGLLERVKQIERESAERLQATPDDADAELEAGLVMMLFESAGRRAPRPATGTRARARAPRADPTRALAPSHGLTRGPRGASHDGGQPAVDVDDLAVDEV